MRTEKHILASEPLSDRITPNSIAKARIPSNSAPINNGKNTTYNKTNYSTLSKNISISDYFKKLFLCKNLPKSVE